MSREYYVKGISRATFVAKLKSGGFAPIESYKHPKEGGVGIKIGEHFGWVDSLDGKMVLVFYGRNDDSKFFDIFERYGGNLRETGDESTLIFSNIRKTPIMEKRFNFGKVF